MREHGGTAPGLAGRVTAARHKAKREAAWEAEGVRRGYIINACQHPAWQPLAPGSHEYYCVSCGALIEEARMMKPSKLDYAILSAFKHVIQEGLEDWTLLAERIREIAEDEWEQVGWKVTITDKTTGQSWWEWQDDGPEPHELANFNSNLERSGAEPLYRRRENQSRWGSAQELAVDPFEGLVK